MSFHLAMRPTWSCGGCGSAWPCETSQRELLAQYRGANVSLISFLVTCLVNAIQELPPGQAPTLHGRFIGWAPAVGQ